MENTENCKYQQYTTQLIPFPESNLSSIDNEMNNLNFIYLDNNSQKQTTENKFLDVGCKQNITQDVSGHKLLNSVMISNHGMNAGMLSSSGMNSGMLSSSGMNSGMISSSGINSGMISSSGMNSGMIQNPFLNSGMISSPGMNSGMIQNPFLNSGMILSPGMNAGMISSSGMNSGMIQNPGMNAGMISSPVMNSGMISSSGMNSAMILNQVMNSGMIQNPRMNSGMISSSGMNSAMTSSPVMNSGMIQNPVMNSGMISSPVMNSAMISSPAMNSEKSPENLYEQPIMNSDMIQNPVSNSHGSDENRQILLNDSTQLQNNSQGLDNDFLKTNKAEIESSKHPDNDHESQNSEFSSLKIKEEGILSRWRSKNKTDGVENEKPGRNTNGAEQRFMGEGLSWKGKLIGVLQVSEARGERICQDALSELKIAVKAAGEHKQKILILISVDGLKIKDEKTGDVLYHHPVHKISFIAQDMADSRAFGYIYGSPENGHRFFGIKTDKSASLVVVSMRDLFQVVVDLKNKKMDEVKRQLESKEEPTYANELLTDNSFLDERAYYGSGARVFESPRISEKNTLIESSGLRKNNCLVSDVFGSPPFLPPPPSKVGGSRLRSSLSNTLETSCVLPNPDSSHFFPPTVNEIENPSNILNSYSSDKYSVFTQLDSQWKSNEKSANPFPSGFSKELTSSIKTKNFVDDFNDLDPLGFSSSPKMSFPFKNEDCISSSSIFSKASESMTPNTVYKNDASNTLLDGFF